MKAILVIDDMPNCCTACPFFEFINGDDHDDCRTYCIAKLGQINEYGAEIRPKWCPLKPMPTKKKTDSTGTIEEYMLKGYDRGWNDCLEEIENESNISD